MHGGNSTGPRSAEGIAAIKRARTVHGRYSEMLVELRQAFAEEPRITRELMRWAEE